ncbi:hypothetical protein F5J12DRAFT_712568 [Pisolithus orientalis]|uniref:uncharacterized protein n=1 Tax=Pisolithus orientalis TaxID=936130 RepID=UPI0022244E64|nr:uncharacterized protein F5J12DRAFT_712568 [Pisolithus orientalis]KAI6033050.1 hypothetical protein F5J12DRAFT_712568 [Pisolithus orientalis]
MVLFRVSRPVLPLTSRVGTLNLSPRGSAVAPRVFHISAPRLTSPPPSSPSDGSSTSLPPDATLSQRLKYLMKSYGWYAAGVYLVLSTLDFTVAFIGVNLLGAEQVSQAAAYIKETVLGVLRTQSPEVSGEETERVSGGGHEGLYAMLVLAYTIHKTLFLPVRIGLTAALTPRLVGWLRARGWAGGEGTRRAAQEMRERLRGRRNDD